MLCSARLGRLSPSDGEQQRFHVLCSAWPGPPSSQDGEQQRFHALCCAFHPRKSLRQLSVTLLGRLGKQSAAQTRWMSKRPRAVARRRSLASRSTSLYMSSWRRRRTTFLLSYWRFDMVFLEKKENNICSLYLLRHRPCAEDFHMTLVEEKENIICSLHLLRHGNCGEEGEQHFSCPVSSTCRLWKRRRTTFALSAPSPLQHGLRGEEGEQHLFSLSAPSPLSHGPRGKEGEQHLSSAPTSNMVLVEKKENNMCSRPPPSHSRS